MRLAAAAALALALLPAPAAPAPAGAPTVVTLKTKDGLSLEADWYRGEEGMPGIVALHMYGADRSSWKPVADLLPAGWHLLAVDLRGHGGSAKQGKEDLGKRVEARDPELFKAMWQDARAGVAFLGEEGKCAKDRIGLLGASVGCSAAFDAAARERGVAAVAALSPGTGYLGVPTLEHLRAWPGIPVLLAAPKEEEAATLELAAALERHPWVDRKIVPGTKELHGTRMFGKAEGIEGELVRWLEAALARQLLDGVVDPVEAAAPAEGRGGVKEVTGASAGSLRLRVDGKSLNIGYTGAAELITTFAVTVTRPASEEGRPAEIQRFRGTASATGALMGAWMNSWSGKAWEETTVNRRPPDAALVQGNVMEVRLPWGMFGVRPGEQVVVDFFPVRSRTEGSAPPVEGAGIPVSIPELEVTK